MVASASDRLQRVRQSQIDDLYAPRLADEPVRRSRHLSRSCHGCFASCGRLWTSCFRPPNRLVFRYHAEDEGGEVELGLWSVFRGRLVARAVSSFGFFASSPDLFHQTIGEGFGPDVEALLPAIACARPTLPEL